MFMHYRVVTRFLTFWIGGFGFEAGTANCMKGSNMIGLKRHDPGGPELSK